MRGHGLSGRTPGCYRLQDYAADIVDFLSEVVGAPAAIFGHSLGAMVALIVAVDAPELVCAIVLGDPPLSLPTLRRHIRNAHARLEGWRRIAGGASPVAEIEQALRAMPVRAPGSGKEVRAEDAFGAGSPYFPWFANCLYHNDPDMLASIIDRFDETFAAWNIEALLPAARCPLLLLQADPAEDGSMTDDEVTSAKALLPSLRHTRFDGLGHPLHAIEPDRVLDEVEPFLRSSARGSSR